MNKDYELSTKMNSGMREHGKVTDRATRGRYSVVWFHWTRQRIFYYDEIQNNILDP